MRPLSTPILVDPVKFSLPAYYDGPFRRSAGSVARRLADDVECGLGVHEQRNNESVQT